jgi:hypothetical protein
MKLSAPALVLLCTMAVAIAQSPQGRPPGPPHPERRLEQLATLLDLTDAQKAQVKTVLDAVHAKMRAQFPPGQASGTRPSFEQIRALREQRKAEAVKQLTPVLNPTQLKKFEVLMEMEEEHAPGGGPRGHGPRGQSSGAPPPSPN